MVRLSVDRNAPESPSIAPSVTEIRAQMDKICDSSIFVNSSRLIDFLRFIVNEALHDRSKNLKAYTIGLEVFERPESFDPIADTIVRVNAGKLRRALERYYLGPGRQDKVHIVIPTGGYVPVFQIMDFEHARRDVNLSAPTFKPLVDIKEPIIAVLPFKKASLEPAHEFIINGLGEELVMALSKFRGIGIVSYYSTSNLDSEQRDLDQIRRIFGADFLITGSIYQASDKFRLNVELLTTNNSQHLWSHRYERDFSINTLFSILDDIVSNIVAAVADDFGIIPKTIARASSAKAPDQSGAYEAVMRFHHFEITLSSLAHKEALQALEETVVKYPNYGLAWALLSILYLDSFIFSFGDLENPIERGTDAARKAVHIDPLCQHAYFGMSLSQLLQRNKEGVIHNARKIIELNPNAAFLVGTAGWFIAMAGQFEEGFEYIGKSIQLNPIFPSWFHFPQYIYLYLIGDYSSALDQAIKFELPDFFWSALMQAAVLGKLGKINEAQAALQRLVSLQPDFPERARFYIECLLIEDRWVDKILEGLKMAGFDRTMKQRHNK